MNKKLLIPILLFIMFGMVKSASADIWAWTTGYSFSLPATSTTVGFSKTAYFDSFTWDVMSSSASELTLANAYTGSGVPVASLVVTAQGCNVTFDNINEDNKIQFNLNAAGNVTLGSFTSQPNMANHTYIYASNMFSFNSTGATTILLDWTSTGGPPSSPSSGSQPQPSPQPTPPTVPIVPPAVPPVEVTTDNSWLLILVGVGAAGLLVASEEKSRRKVRMSGVRQSWSQARRSNANLKLKWKEMKAKKLKWRKHDEWD